MLHYDATTEILTLPDGTVFRAVSGGGRGARRVRRNGAGRRLATRLLAVDGERDWTVKATETRRGGPLPPGLYLVHPPSRHPRLGLACFLEPYPGNEMQGRDDFWIHGPGPRGSDGCIVPLGRPGQRRGLHHLMAALARLAPTTLRVNGAG